MPGRDGTGPMGAGPMTGRAAGRCAGNHVGGFGACGRGLGLGRGGAPRGAGRGLGIRNRQAAGVQPVDAEQESAYLENSVKALEEELAAAKKRLDELKG